MEPKMLSRTFKVLTVVQATLVIWMFWSLVFTSAVPTWFLLVVFVGVGWLQIGIMKQQGRSTKSVLVIAIPTTILVLVLMLSPWRDVGLIPWGGQMGWW